MSDTKNNESKLDFNDWIHSLYDVSKLTDDELDKWYEVYQYKGFDRLKVLKQLKSLVGDIKEVMQIILVCAIRGPQRAAKTKLLSGETIEGYHIPGSGMKGKEGISCQRITAATADLAAFFMRKLNVPKRLPVACPGWLQFPSAGSIKLPEDLRLQHIEFHQKFSTVIGGVFNEQIYQQMVNNAYLDPELHLFDDHVVQPQPILPQLPLPAPRFNPIRGDVGPGVVPTPVTKTSTTTTTSSISSTSSAAKTKQ
jgi:hypothetical protein